MVRALLECWPLELVTVSPTTCWPSVKMKLALGFVPVLVSVLPSPLKSQS